MNNPIIKKQTRLSSVWIIPLIAIVVSLWFVVQHYMQRGTEIEIRFESAEGIEAGRTLIKTLNVEVGVVTQVEINQDLKTVRVLARIKSQAEDLLRQDSQFWVVKPRVGSKGISGLGTLLSGAYIELEPGNDYPGKTSFIGLENPPLTPANKKGLNIYLISDSAASLNAGDPVLFKGFEVGQVTQIEILNASQLKTSLFIESPYDKMVTSHTRFYNASGISLHINAQSVAMHTDAMETTLTGGIAFDLPKFAKPGRQVVDGTEFTLYADRQSIDKHPYQYSADYLLLFDRSVRGLNVGEVVEYRGIKVGSVIDIDFKYLPKEQFEQAQNPKVPVLIRIDPGRMIDEDGPKSADKLTKLLRTHINRGLKAALKTGSLVTGQSFIQLDFYPDLAAGTMQKVGRYHSIPTTADDLDSLISNMTAFTHKLNQLPLEQSVEQINQTLAGVNKTVSSLEQTVNSLNKLVQSTDNFVGSEALNELPVKLNQLIEATQTSLNNLTSDSGLTNELNNTLLKLKSTLNSVQRAADKVEQKPNSVIFGADKHSDLIPGSDK
ncbi:intermembrane transport protein PqiB [Catenovulum sp. 2E275]|uniref:intermembrane transport protein PqiB n=1 Tax=Catenovulum sp. 2E275 TaxID=2980497 RepID=UPI0021D2AC34|nr:intermembrane transport protein PqiB [Catenovulum sp. 2E275]MCU4676011.1 intermembrane transport protein PqiB [Catenovulum sp. 2E275]